MLHESRLLVGAGRYVTALFKVHPWKFLYPLALVAHATETLSPMLNTDMHSPQPIRVAAFASIAYLGGRGMPAVWRGFLHSYPAHEVIVRIGRCESCRSWEGTSHRQYEEFLGIESPGTEPDWIELGTLKKRVQGRCMHGGCLQGPTSQGLSDYLTP